mgnify:CR=1 FL=1
MSETVNGEIGRRLRKVRLMLGIKVKDMADSLGLTVGHYRKLERGEHAINASLLTLLHGIYGIDLNYLITGRAREEDLAKDLMCGNQKEMFFLLHRLLDSCEKIHRDDAREEDEDGDEEHC